MPFTALKLPYRGVRYSSHTPGCVPPNAVYGIETFKPLKQNLSLTPVVRRLMPFTALKPQPVEFYLDLTDGGMLYAA